MNIVLPYLLETYKKTIGKSIRPYIAITPSPSEDLSVFQSKFGGEPYWPSTLAFPTNADGKPFAFLAQINFAELSEMPEFPTKGILSFFIDTYDAMLGLDFDNRTVQNGFKVIYFADIEQNSDLLCQDFSFLKNNEYPLVAQPSDIQFELRYAPVSLSDYSFEKQMGVPSYEMFSGLDENSDQAIELYDTLTEAHRHKLGGYPYFTQEDPRYAEETEYTLLFQVNSDETLGLTWGDMGIANFFIRPEALAKSDFSEVYYNWDCA